MMGDIKPREVPYFVDRQVQRLQEVVVVSNVYNPQLSIHSYNVLVTYNIFYHWAYVWEIRLLYITKGMHL